MTNQKVSYYANIPADVRYDEDLKPNEKLLYGEISALCNKQGFCWAKNEYFAELYDVTKQTISNWVSNLDKQGHVVRKVDKEAGNKRKIYLSEVYNKKYIGIKEKDKGCIKKDIYPETGRGQSNQQGNGGNNGPNNTMNNTMNENNKGSSRKGLIKQFKTPYKDMLGVSMINTGHLDELIKYVDNHNMTPDLIIKGMKQTKLATNPTMFYLKNKLDRWLKKDVTCVSDLEDNSKSKNNNTATDSIYSGLEMQF